ncbi:MAG TPA: hypothetical protein VNU01_08210 [Egibacteraceae bacterium]|nr:hypothetical protein [Egibacteraceae bacterium]
MIDLAGTQPRFRPSLIAAATEGRQIDRGNAGLRSMEEDFRRLGVGGLNSRIAARNSHWSRTPTRRGDCAFYADLIELRNALAHGNQRQLERLRSRGVMDTVTWARDRLAGLDRIARALDLVVWDHVVSNFGVEPW